MPAFLHLVEAASQQLNMSGAPPGHAAVSHVLAADEPPIVVPPGMGPKSALFLGYMKWGGLVGGIASTMAAGIMMIVGRRNRSSMAVDGAAGLPWIFIGLSVVSFAASLAGAFIS